VSMHWYPLKSEAIASAPPEGAWFTVASWCGCGIYLGCENGRSPGTVSFYADHVCCTGPPTFSVTWIAPRPPWVRPHP
jgi:hypothetical protein